MNIKEDIGFVETILPSHYVVKESKSKGSIHCVSNIGIKEGIDNEDDEHWYYIMMSIRKRFGERFSEILHIFERKLKDLEEHWDDAVKGNYEFFFYYHEEKKLFSNNA